MEILKYYALIVATILTLGETLILIRTDKYWPLSVDDYLVCALLFFTALTLDQTLSQLLMLMAWVFMVGNLYAMLFTRLDPRGGSRERLGALAVMLLLGLGGSGATLTLLI